MKSEWVHGLEVSGFWGFGIYGFRAFAVWVLVVSFKVSTSDGSECDLAIAAIPRPSPLCYASPHAGIRSFGLQ